MCLKFKQKSNPGLLLQRVEYVMKEYRIAVIRRMLKMYNVFINLEFTTLTKMFNFYSHSNNHHSDTFGKQNSFWQPLNSHSQTIFMFDESVPNDKSIVSIVCSRLYTNPRSTSDTFNLYKELRDFFKKHVNRTRRELWTFLRWKASTIT